MSVEALETERDELRREVVGLQEMMAQVLQAVGEPVEVTKAALAKGLPEGSQIRIDDNIEADSFFFYLELPE